MTDRGRWYATDYPLEKIPKNKKGFPKNSEKQKKGRYMVIVSRGMFDEAVREYANYAFPDKPGGGKWTYYSTPERRIGAYDDGKCMLEDDIVREMSTRERQIKG